MKLIISAAAALALLAGAARAGDKAADKSATSNDTKAAAPSNSQITGDVKSIDAPAMTLIIVLPSGEQQQLSVASDASIKRAPAEGVLFDNLDGRRFYEPSIFHGQAKLAAALYAKELSRRLGPRGVSVNSLHPGYTRGTGFDKYRQAAISLRSPIPAHRWKRSRRRRVLPASSTATRPSADATRCCRRSGWCRRPRPGSI